VLFEFFFGKVFFSEFFVFLAAKKKFSCAICLPGDVKKSISVSKIEDSLAKH
jgi:hypothetical protein